METVAAGIRGLRYADRRVELGGTYAYQVAAAVHGGETVRSALVPVQVPCGFTVTPSHRDVLWTAGTGQVTVTTGPNCAWTATSESAFLTVTVGSAGVGPGAVTYTVSPNGDEPRTGVLLVAGQRITMYQASPTRFTDHPIQRGMTPVKTIHFLEAAGADRCSAHGGGPAGVPLDEPDADAGSDAGAAGASDRVAGRAGRSVRREGTVHAGLHRHCGDGWDDRRQGNALDGAARRGCRSWREVGREQLPHGPVGNGGTDTYA